MNVSKVLDFLKHKERFNKRHLWSGKEICRGDKETVWELLTDIREYYTARKNRAHSTKHEIVEEQPNIYFAPNRYDDKEGKTFANLRNKQLQSYNEVHKYKKSYERALSAPKKATFIVFDAPVRPSSPSKNADLSVAGDFNLEVKNRMFNYNMNMAGVEAIDFKQNIIELFRDSTALAKLVNYIVGNKIAKEMVQGKSGIINNFATIMSFLRNKVKDKEQVDLINLADLEAGRGEAVRQIMKLVVENKSNLN